MKSELKIPRELLIHIDVMNTLNGGTSEPSVMLRQFDSYREIALRIPGVPREHINVEINNNKLSVHYITPVKSGDVEISVPKVLYNKVIPYFVDIHRISVREDKGTMVIRLPFNELADGYHRELTTEH